MAVLKNKRGVSQYEYEHTFNAMYEYFRVQLNKVPIRRKKWVSEPITTILRNIHANIMELSTGFVQYDKRAEYRHNIIIQILHDFAKLQKPLYTYWAVIGTDLKHIETWCELINKEIALLSGMLQHSPCYTADDDLVIQYMMYYKREDIENVQFLSNMRNLLLYSHGKVIHAQKQFNGFESDMIIELVDNAWYHCLEANKKIPKTKSEYNQRCSHLSQAISNLRKLNRPMLSFFIMIGYSERVMREWADLLSEELRLIYALQKSDKRRFRELA